MKTFTSLIFTSTLLLSSLTAFAQNPATSTSEMQVEKEQRNNPGHIADDCRAATGTKMEECKSGEAMRKEHKGNEKTIKQGGTTDDVMQKDATKSN